MYTCVQHSTTCTRIHVGIYSFSPSFDHRIGREVVKSVYSHVKTWKKSSQWYRSRKYMLLKKAKGGQQLRLKAGTFCLWWNIRFIHHFLSSCVGVGLEPVGILGHPCVDTGVVVSARTDTPWGNTSQYIPSISATPHWTAAVSLATNHEVRNKQTAIIQTPFM